MIITFCNNKRECSFNLDYTEDTEVVERYIKHAMEALPETDLVIYWDNKTIEKIKDVTPESIIKQLNKCHNHLKI